MVNHQIHHDLNIAFFGFRDQIFHLGQRAEFSGDVLIIGDVIAVVVHWRFINRRQPDDIDTELLQIIEFADDTGQITHTIVIRIAEAAWVNLIHHGVVPPFFA